MGTVVASRPPHMAAFIHMEAANLENVVSGAALRALT